MTESIAHQGKEKAAEGPECLVCRGTHWTFYEVENLNGEWEQCQELCENCKLALLANGPSTRSTREERGIALAKERFDEIVKIRPWTWSVPSQSGEGSYEVNIKFLTCQCADSVTRPSGEPCKHYASVMYVKARTDQCVGCRKRFRYHELIEVTEWHESLTWFEGDLLCWNCAEASGVI